MFDQPEPVQPIGSRGVATVPTQALALMNAPLVRTAAEHLAKRARNALSIEAAAVSGDTAVASCFRAALARAPSPAELEAFTGLLSAREEAAGNDMAGRQAALADVCQLIFCLNEFIYVD